MTTPAKSKTRSPASGNSKLIERTRRRFRGSQRRQPRSRLSRSMAKLLLADRIKDRNDTFLGPLIPALERHHDVRFISVGPGPDLAEAIAWAQIVWLEW